MLLVYGLIRGLDQSTPHVILPQFIGGAAGRYYFAKKFGESGRSTASCSSPATAAAWAWS